MKFNDKINNKEIINNSKLKYYKSVIHLSFDLKTQIIDHINHLHNIFYISNNINIK